MSVKAPLTFIHWICNAPKGQKLSIESLCSLVCRDKGYNRVIIRHGPHPTTKLFDGTVVKDELHITADLLQSETGVGKAAHIYVDKELNLQSVDLLGDVQYPPRNEESSETAPVEDK